MKLHCWNCHDELRTGKRHRYCGNKCQNDYQWEHVTKPRIRKGLVNNSKTLRRFVIERDGEECVKCGIGTEWNDKPLTLELDHKDGNSDNNKPRNLRLLCPNCHSQTPTHGSKGMGNRYKKNTKRNRYLRAYKDA